VTPYDFPWPPIEGSLRPEWTGEGFRVAGRSVPVLAYSGGQSGWSDNLTRMHEDAAGSDHPIDRLSRAWAARALRRDLHARSPVLLEIGSSSGFFLEALRKEWPGATIIGSDFLEAPLLRLAARLRDIPIVQFDLVRCPLPEACADAVVLLNVLEHIEDDRAAIGQVARILQPGGVAIVEVPAGPQLYDLYDEHLRHYRRYTSHALATLLEGAGLEVIRSSHLGCSVYPAFAAVKRRNQRLSAAEADTKRRVVEANIQRTRASAPLRLLLAIEGAIGRVASYPFGIRCVAVARKPAGP
jgi:SAM-dependent methyltransferase